VNHVPGYIQNLPKLREKGVDIVAVLAFNDPFVMSAWGKANQVQNNEIVSINCVEFISGSWSSSSSIRHVRYILTRAPRIALPVGPRCQVLQEHWLGRQCFRSHRSLRHCYRPRKGPICGYRDREGCCHPNSTVFYSTTEDGLLTWIPEIERRHRSGVPVGIAVRTSV
jgi:hypothetical protein